MDDIENVVLPFLDSTLQYEENIVKANTNQTAVADSKNKIPQIVGAIKGWQSLIDRNTQLSNQARTGKLDKHRVTHLVADTLLKDSSGNDNVKFINGSAAPDANYLRNISAISFGGAGALISYSESSKSSSEGITSSSFTSTSESGFVGEGQVIVTAVGIHSAGSDLKLRESSSTFGLSIGSSKATGKGFVLGDKDQGDYFDVQIYKDPVFGSFVFNTMSGQSRYVYLGKLTDNYIF